MAVNKAAWLHTADTPLEVFEAPMPVPGPNEIIVKNAAIAINPLDWHMSKLGIFIQQWPAIFGCDVAGTVHEVGSDVNGRFKVGDRVIGHTINLVTGRPQDGAFALYTAVSVEKAALLPSNIPFTSGVVVPTALEAAICALFVSEPGTALPGVSIPTLGLSNPSLEPTSVNKTLVVYGGSSSVGSMTIQLATAAGIKVVAVAGKKNFDLAKQSGAVEIFDYKDPEVVEKVVKAVEQLGKEGGQFVGIVDAISIAETYTHDLAILAKLGGGHLACTHPPPPAEDIPANVEAGMVFAVNDAATPIWGDFVTQALEAGALKCLPPTKIVGKGLEHVQEGLKLSEAGVSGIKLVIEL